jgi:uncharacterized protein YndB with AHSA1/START domain
VIRRQVVLPVGPDRLWEALTDPDEASGWLGGRIEWEVNEGAPLRFHDDDGRRREGRIDTVRTGRYLRYRWWTVASPVQPVRPGHEAGEAGEAGDTGQAREAGESEVTYLIEPHEDGSRLTIQERGIPTSSPTARLSSGRVLPGDTVSSFSWTRWDDRMVGAWVGLWAANAARASV